MPSRGCVPEGGAVHDRTGSDIITPPPHRCEQNESQMLLKILPCPKIRLRAVTKERLLNVKTFQEA